MIAELVTTGSELLLGQIVNTNAAYMARELNRMGIDVCFQTTVGDNRVRMKEVLVHALTRADLVITSGGLGRLGAISRRKSRRRSWAGKWHRTRLAWRGSKSISLVSGVR